MGLFGWLFGEGRKSDPKGDFRKNVGIDVSGPEFSDLYPDVEDVRDRLARSGMFRQEALPWIASTLRAAVANGGGYRNAVTAVVRTGTQLSPEQLKSIGLNARRKVGAEFVKAVAANHIEDAIEALEQTITVATSTAAKHRTLWQAAEIGATHVKLLSAGDERSTAIEKAYGGRKLTLDQARKLIGEHEGEIARSVFQTIIKF